MSAVQAASHSSASLYVGDLHNDVTETQLFEVFKEIGPVVSIRVCRDAVTRRSLGYAYVNFHNIADAERALDLLNFKEFKGKPCRIMWSQRDPSLRKSGAGNIFIKNLDKSIDNKTLYDTFSVFGNILSCKVATDESASSKGYGFVHFEKEEEADLAIKMVNEKLLNGKKCYVAKFIPNKTRIRENEPKWTNIYVKNLAKTVEEQRLKDLFLAFGDITSIYLAIDESKSSKGFGFINYKIHENARQAVEEMNGKEIDGEQIYVGRAQKKAEREKELKQMFEKIKRERMSKYQGVNLYVKNLDDTIDDVRLREEFAHCGTITSAKVMRDENTGQSKGFGFVCFSTPDEATKAVTEMNGKMLVNKPIYVALAQRKEQRRAQLEAQHAQRANSIRMTQGLAGPPMPGAPMYPSGVPSTLLLLDKEERLLCILKWFLEEQEDSLPKADLEVSNPFLAVSSFLLEEPLVVPKEEALATPKEVNLLAILASNIILVFEIHKLLPLLPRMLLPLLLLLQLPLLLMCKPLERISSLSSLMLSSPSNKKVLLERLLVCS